MDKMDCEKLERYFNQIPGLMMIDMEGTVFYINDQCLKYFQAKKEEFLGKHVKDVFPETKMMEGLEKDEPSIVFYNSFLGIGISMHLSLIHILEEFEISDDRKSVTVKRQLEDGYELIEVQLPCLLTTIKELNTPRYMKIAGIYGDKDIKTWNARDIEVDLTKVGLEASPTNVFRSFTPAPKEPGIKIKGDSEKELAKNLLINLKGKHVI